MELIRINDNKLKIMLTSSDMKNYALDVQKLSCGTEETRRAFRNILHDAGVCSDPDEGKDKIYIQYYPSREGGCEMFVTRLALLKSEGSTGEFRASDEQTAQGGQSEIQLAPSCLSKNAKHDPRQEAGLLSFRFDTLSALLLACHRSLAALSGTPPTTQPLTSEAYRDESNCFYLLLKLSKRSTSQEHPADTHPLYKILAEFGHAIPYSSAHIYLQEHGDTLCRKDALRTLGNLC